MNGTVLALYIAQEKGRAMEERPNVSALAGIGLEGDRYALGGGAWSDSKRKTMRHVSLIAQEAIDEANAALERPFERAETRRNIVTQGIDLNALVGKEFLVGSVRMRGVELCDPCGRPSKLSGKDGFEAAFQLRGGLRAEILSSGPIAVGDAITDAPANTPIEVTDFIEGPFVIVVTDPQQPGDRDYPMVIAPPGGFQDKETAVRFIETFAARKTPYLGLKFQVSGLRTPDSFVRYCSWEE